METNTPPAGVALKTAVALDRVIEMDETRTVRPVDHQHAFLMSMSCPDLPPIDVVKLRDKKFGVLAGYHRLEAHRLAGASKIKVVVWDLDPEEYHAFACRSNATHGKPLTLSERRANAKLMLADHPDWSDREIGRNCGLDHKTIGKLRWSEPEPETSGEIPTLTQSHPYTPDGLDAAFAEIATGPPSPETILEYADTMEAAARPESESISKPDLGGGISHPARFSALILDTIRRLLDIHLGRGFNPEGHTPKLLDPFAGTGGIYDLNHRDGVTYHDWEIFGIELEPEWAALDQRTFVGNALDIPTEDAYFEAIVTSPCYGNRLADHHNASDPERRRSYTHDLGRPLSPDNAGALQWGPEYRDFHERAWKEVTRVLRPGGLFVLNIKDHTRDGRRQFVAGWHVTALCRLGFTLLEHVPVDTPSLRVGENSEARWPEQVYVFRLGEEGHGR